MTVDEQDPAVVRLRRESGSVVVAPSRVDVVLRRVHERRRVQRQHRVQAFAALSVVLVAVAGALLVNRDWRTDVVTPLSTQPVAEWPVRGSLAGDADLLARAEATWRQSPHRPSGAVRTLFAGVPPYSGTANFAVVAMVSAEGSVAFVTTPAAPQVDTSNLLLRAVGAVAADQPAIGFVSAARHPSDAVGGLMFALAAPGIASPQLQTSAMDYTPGNPIPLSDGSAWAQMPESVGAWNSRLTTPVGDAAPAGGVLDPPTGPARLVQGPGGLRVEGAAPGDLIVTPDGVLGTAAADGSVDTRLSALGELQMYLTGVTGRVAESGEFIADGPANPSNRVVLVRGPVTVTVGRLTPDGAGWRVHRAVDPLSAPADVRWVRP
ncbi:hypothetical protein [Actinokineospora sp. NPDC004072]